MKSKKTKINKNINTHAITILYIKTKWHILQHRDVVAYFIIHCLLSTFWHSEYILVQYIGHGKDSWRLI